MHYYSGFTYLSGFAILSGVCVYIGFFDASYKDDERTKSLQISVADLWCLEWLKFHVVMLASFAAIIIHGWGKTTTGKVTVLDFFFLVIFNGLAIMQSAGLYLLFRYHLPGVVMSDKDLFLRVSRLRAFADWATLPCLGWIIAWSRHVRRGWYPRRNRIVFAVSTLVFYFTIIHKTAYAFQLCIAGGLSSIAVYELYNTHFFRAGVRPMSWMIITANIIFCITRLIDPYVGDVGWCLYYVNVTSMTFVTVVLSIMLLKILEEVNQHKI